MAAKLGQLYDVFVVEVSSCLLCGSSFVCFSCAFGLNEFASYKRKKVT